MRSDGVTWRVVCLVGALAVFLPSTSRAADHREAPALQIAGSPAAPVDIADVYVFVSPEDSDAVVFILTVNPEAGQTVPAPFRANAKYNLMIDKDGDAKEDARITFDFGRPDSAGVQNVKLRSVGLKGMRGQGRTGENVVAKKNVRLHAGVFDDPFFFDQAGFLGDGGRALCDASASDSFARKDVSAIVLEVPRSRLGGSRFGVWARTRAFGGQVDRMGYAGINALLVPPTARDAFNRGLPKNDLRVFFGLFLDALTGLGGDPVDAAVIAGFYLPDILRFDASQPAEYPNGRRLEEDVIDLTLPLLGGDPPVVTDCVDANDVVFRPTFPYLAPAHGVGTPCLDDDGDGFPVLVPADCDPGGVPLDCDDFFDFVYPGAPESCDVFDSDCDGSLVDEFTNSDADPAPDCVDIDDDNDGWFDGQDCAPTDPLIFPGADEICGNARDDDCDGTADESDCVAP